MFKKYIKSFYYSVIQYVNCIAIHNNNYTFKNSNRLSYFFRKELKRKTFVVFGKRMTFNIAY